MENFFGIVGGMGTIASTQFLNEMNCLYRPETDQQFLNYVVWNNASTPDRTSHILDHTNESPYEYLLHSCKTLEKLGTDFIVIPCNTAHYYLKELQEEVYIPILNMLDIMENYISQSDATSFGIMATNGTLESGLFQEMLHKTHAYDIEPHPKYQSLITSLIYEDVKPKGYANFEKYNQILEHFYEQGADEVILACTELSFIESMKKQQSSE